MADEVLEADIACLDHYDYFFRPNILQGKVAFITGGGSGIGFTITEVLMRHSCSTVIVGRNFDRLEKAAKKLENVTGQKCLPVKMDVRKVDEVDAAVDMALKHFSKIDILVNSAAGNFLCPASQLSYNGMKTVFDIDAFGTFNVSKAVYNKCFKNNGNGNIINITATLHYTGNPLQVIVNESSPKTCRLTVSKLSAIKFAEAMSLRHLWHKIRKLDDQHLTDSGPTGFWGALLHNHHSLCISQAGLCPSSNDVPFLKRSWFESCHHCDESCHAGSAKAAIEGMSRHLAVEWGPDGVRVNCVAPGAVKDTEGFRRLGGKQLPPNFIENVPLQRLVLRQDVADSVLFLASGASAFITANTLVVDGGSWITNSVSMAAMNKAISKL